MWVDVVVGMLVGLSALTGAWRGTVSALMRMGTLAVAYVAARAAGPHLAAPFGGPEVVAPPIAVAQASFVAFLGIYVVSAGLLSHLFGRLYDGAQERATGTDRAVGGLLSAARSAGLCFVLISGLIYSNRFFAANWPALWVDYDASHVGRWVRSHNAFLPEAFPHQWALERLAQESREGTWRQGGRRDPALQRLFARPEASALFEPELLAALQAGRTDTLARDPRLQQLLADPLARRDLDLLNTGALGPVPLPMPEADEGPRAARVPAP